MNAAGHSTLYRESGANTWWLVQRYAAASPSALLTSQHLAFKWPTLNLAYFSCVRLLCLHKTGINIPDAGRQGNGQLGAKFLQRLCDDFARKVYVAIESLKPNSNALEHKKVLGEGSFGSVSLFWCPAAKRDFAVKTCKAVRLQVYILYVWYQVQNIKILQERALWPYHRAHETAVAIVCMRGIRTVLLQRPYNGSSPPPLNPTPPPSQRLRRTVRHVLPMPQEFGRKFMHREIRAFLK